MIFLILLACTCFFFALFNIEVMNSLLAIDGTQYMYIAERMNQGAVLYKDIFITNTPLTVYIYWLYKTILFNNLALFYLTGILETSIISIFIYLISKRIHKSDPIAFLTALIYLLSFTIQSNTMPTGVTTVLLFMVVGYYLYLKDNILWASAMFALALSAKAYTLAFSAAFLVSVYVFHRKLIIKSIAVFVFIGFLVMLPTLLFALPAFLQQTFGYSLVRETVTDWLVPFLAFVMRDWIIVLLCIVTVINYKKRLFPALAILFITLFFVLYRDKHFLYYTLFVPFSVFAFGDIVNLLKNKFAELPILISAGILIVIMSIINVPATIEVTYKNNRVRDTEGLLQLIRNEKPDYLFGITFITQGASYLTGVPMINNLADTNEVLFKSGRLDRVKITKDAINSRTLIITMARNYPEGKAYPYNTMDMDEILKKCKPVHSQAFSWAGSDELLVFKCYK